MENDNWNISIDKILAETKNTPEDEQEFTEDFYAEATPEAAEPQAETKKRWSLFGRKKNKKPDFDETEDAYYGVQIRPLDEIRMGFDSIGEIGLDDNTYTDLFNNTMLDEEVEKNFDRIQRERRRRVAEAVETAGVNEDDMANELGIVAPMPVTSFAADPYNKTHGLSSDTDSDDTFQRAMMHTAESQTMEIKLNVLNDTVELQKNLPAVDDETVSKILETAETEKELPPPERLDSDAVSQPPSTVLGASQNTSMYLKIPSEPMAEFPKLDTLEQYRNKTVPIHIVNIDVLQSVILSESAVYEKKGRPAKAAPFDRFIAKLKEDNEEDSTESIDDYTSPADAKSISNELRGSMRSLSIRLLVTGLSTGVLLISSIAFEAGFSNKDPANNAIPYLIMNLFLVLVSAGFCFKSIVNGIKNLLRFNANADSAAAVAVVAVLLQSVLGFLFLTPLATGTVHLYGLIVSLALFLNTLGKLTMLRRIHSNFRFISAREQKYVVKIYGDYNTSLKMAKDCVAEAPVIAYQKKTAFLKRFLQLSYDPDPSELSSQNLAPMGLILSLVLCLVCLFTTKDLYLALTAFAASCCICVATANMLSVNLPISRLCKKARRAGAMLVGWNAVSQMTKTNALMMDSSDLFPSGTVVLDGIKTLGTASAESAMLKATALIREIGGTLADVFEQVSGDYEDSLPKVTNLTLEDEHGVSGVVDGKTVLIGNRTLLMNHHIDPPERDEVTKFTAGGKKVLFVAIGGKLETMLLLTYKADRRKAIELQRMEEHGISLIVRSTDANITQNLVGKLFGISPSSVSVLTGALAETYADLVEDELPRADALVATKGRVESMMHMVSTCVREKRTISLVIALQNISVILGFVLVAFMSCFSGFAQLSAIALFIYECFWLAVLILLPRIKKP